MKKFLERFGALFAALAIVVTTMNENATCVFVLHQEPLPKEAKKLRKF